MRAQIEGSVMLECIVDTTGKVSQATVIRSLDPVYGLDAKAVEAARQWRFKPGTRDGVEVPVWITIELTFKLRK
jgi:protein TonB